MTVLSVTEDTPSGEGEWSPERRNYTRHFIAETDTYDDNMVTVASDPRIPQMYSSFWKGTEYDEQAIVMSISARRMPRAPLFWRVRCQYSAVMQQDALPQPGPLSIEYRLPEITVAEEIETEVRRQDKNGNDIKNTAGDWFHDQPLKNIRIKVFTVRRWTRTFANLISASMAWEDKINESPFWGYDAEHLLSSGLPTARRLTDIYGTYYETHQIIRYHPNSWKLILPNVGFNSKVSPSISTSLVRMQDEEGQPITEPSYINADGSQWKEGQPKPDPLTFNIYELYDFALMNLPPLDVVNPIG